MSSSPLYRLDRRLKGDNPDSLFVNSFTFLYLFSYFPHISSLLVVVWNMPEGSYNLSASADLHTSKGLDVCFNFCLFTDYD